MSVEMMLFSVHNPSLQQRYPCLEGLPCSHRHKSIPSRYEVTMNNEDDMTNVNNRTFLPFMG